MLLAFLACLAFGAVSFLSGVAEPSFSLLLILLAPPFYLLGLAVLYAPRLVLSLTAVLIVFPSLVFATAFFIQLGLGFPVLEEVFTCSLVFCLSSVLLWQFNYLLRDGGQNGADEAPERFKPHGKRLRLFSAQRWTRRRANRRHALKGRLTTKIIPGRPRPD